MGVNKIVYGGQTKLDISNDTVTPSALLEGYTAHDNTGALIVGTASGGGEGGNVWQDANGYLHLDDESGIDLQTKSVTPTETAQSVTPDAGYYALEKVNVGAISNTYVGSGITQRSSSDLTASGATVTAPAGYYSVSASKSVASGTAGTPTATKGTVSNHSISVTPSVTNTTGYITGGTKTGTAVPVSASELVSGTLTISSSGTKDVTNYASASVASGSATASATKGTVSNHSISVTPSVTRTAGYITAGSSNGTAVTVSASELVSGTLDVNSAGTKDVTNYASVSIPSGTQGTPTFNRNNGTNSVTLTPVVVNSAGYINGGSKNGTSVTISASELVSGTKTITENGTGIDVTNYASVDVDVPSSPSSGGELKAFIERTTATPTLPSDLTKIANHAFSYYDTLALTELPSGITSIGTYAFHSCSALALTSLPSGLTTISDFTFHGCTNLALTSLPSGITSIGSGAFYGCCNMPLTSLPSGLTTIGSTAFQGCRSMVLTTIPSSVTSISSNAFNACTGLVNIQCDGIMGTVGTDAFTCNSTYPSNLETLRFPNLSKGKSVTWSTVCGTTTVANAAQKLRLADIGFTYRIAASAFANCYALKTLILRRTTVCSLANVSAFLNTPMRGYNSLTGTVYVPSDLISSYQTATNWSTLYNDGTVTFAAIEGSEYELD